MNHPSRRLLAALATLVLFAGIPRATQAQGFPIKSSLAASGVTGCSAFAADAPQSSSPNPGTGAEAQQLISDAEAAALQGEHVAARDAFTKAAALVPDNARVAYYLGREHEALNENTNAVRQYCRYLALTPSAPDADEVRGRVVRLTPATELARVEDARTNFQSAVALLRRQQYAAADSVFGFVAGRLPAAPEPFFNRGLARAAQGDRANAMQDFERYLELAPQAADRARLRDAMSRLPDRVYSPSKAFGSGLLVPGLGQMSTGRPLLGVLSLGAVGAGVALALRTEDEITEKQFTDPFGTPYTDSITRTTRPQLTVGLATAGAVWLGAALESIFYARRSRARAEAIIARDPVPAQPRTIGIRVAPLRRGRLAVGITIR